MRILISITCVAVLLVCGVLLKERWDAVPTYNSRDAERIDTMAQVRGKTLAEEEGNFICEETSHWTSKRQISCMPDTEQMQKLEGRWVGPNLALTPVAATCDKDKFDALMAEYQAVERKREVVRQQALASSRKWMAERHPNEPLDLEQERGQAQAIA